MGFWGDVGDYIFGQNPTGTTSPANAQLQDAEWLRRQSQAGLMAAQQRAAPQAGYTRVAGTTMDTAPQAQFRQGQYDLAQRINAIGSGQKMGAGELAAMRQGNRAVAQQQAFARMQRGGNSAMAARDAARNAGNIGLATAGQAQQAALGDQMAANQLAGSLYGQGREQDIGLAGQQAQLAQQRNLTQAQLNQSTSLANMQAKLQQMGMNDQAALAYMAQIHGISLEEMQARLAQEQATLGNKGIFPDLLQAAGTAGAAAMTSDRRLKKDIASADATIDDLLDKLKPYTYRYKDEKHGEGPRPGIMAQDLNRSEAGKQIVRRDAEGLKVDINAAISTALAASARLNKRLRALEGKRK